LLGLSTDGLLGLSPTFVSVSGAGELYLTSLKKAGMISNALFSISLQHSTNKSRMWFGGYDETVLQSYYNSTFLINKTDDNLITWMPLTSK
jgi:hypothetical protein